MTEIGFPGNASRYDDSIAFCREMGVGAMLFQAMLGKDRFIFGDSQGIVYDDGQVRYEEDARALRAWGRAQGRLYTELTDTVQKTDFTGYAPQVLPNGFGVDAVVREMRNGERMPGVDRIWLPGEQSHAKRESNLREGVPIVPALLASLDKLAADLGIPSLQG